MAFSLNGCGQQDTSMTSGNIIDGSVNTKMSEDIAKYETLVQSEPTPENHLALANAYQVASQMKNQRNTLEFSYRLTSDVAALDALQSIVVNTAEESPAIQSEVDRLIQNISIPEYNTEAVGMFMSPEWMSLMMPKIKDGHRNYYFTDSETQDTIYIQVGYMTNNGNNPYTKTWYISGADQQVTAISYENNTAVIMNTGMTEGQYDGPFTAWTCIGDVGAIYHDSGTFKNGIMVGDFSSNVFSLDEPMDLFALVSTREGNDFVPYQGHFGEDGVSTMEQPNHNAVAYGYTQDKSAYLFYDLVGELGSGYIFDSSFLGFTPYPTFTQYTPLLDEKWHGETMIDLSKIQVRVYDNMIELFDGTSWHTVGDVNEYIQADPFLEMNNMENDNPDDNSTTNDQEPWTAGRGRATTGKDTGPTPTKPSQPKPTPPKPTPQPDKNDKDDKDKDDDKDDKDDDRDDDKDDDNDYRPNPNPNPNPNPPPAPDPDPTPPPAPDPTPPPTPDPPDTGTDGEDIGWTDDFL